MTEHVDLSVCQVGDLCYYRSSGTAPFLGKTPVEYHDHATHPYLVGAYSHLQNGRFHADRIDHHDIVRVLRDGQQIQPSADHVPEAGQVAGDSMAVMPEFADERNVSMRVSVLDNDLVSRGPAADRTAAQVAFSERVLTSEEADNMTKILASPAPPPEPDAPDAAGVVTGPGKRVEWLTKLLSEATDLFYENCTELGADEWVWMIQASAAVQNRCVKCSALCDHEGECVSSDCCFGRSKLAALVAAGKGE